MLVATESSGTNNPKDKTRTLINTTSELIKIKLTVTQRLVHKVIYNLEQKLAKM